MNPMKKLLNNKETRTTAVTFLVVIVAYAVMQTLLSMGMLGSAVKGFLVPICAYIVLAVSLNLLVGVCGELSLGHAGFMGIGAFTGIVIASLTTEMIPNDALRLACAMIGGLFLVLHVPNFSISGAALSISIEHRFLEIDDLTGSIRKKLPKIASVLFEALLLQKFFIQSAEQILEFLIQGFIHYRESTSSSQILPAASAGIFQSPRGPRPTEPTFTPSGMQLRLNC